MCGCMYCGRSVLLASNSIRFPQLSGKTVRILGIESSCDETGAAVVNSEGQILGEALASQAAIHAQWGGVVPKLAQGAHEEAIDGIVEEALEKSGTIVRLMICYHHVRNSQSRVLRNQWHLYLDGYDLRI